MSKPIKIHDGQRLSDDDDCYHYMEYVAGAGYSHSHANNLIYNLKADVVAQPQRTRYKQRAIQEVANLLAGSLSLDALRSSVTLVPMPCSKPSGDPRHDDRMTQVLMKLGAIVGNGFDMREVLETTVARTSQHSTLGATRITVDGLMATMAVRPMPLRQTVLLVDDVFTLGTSFVAAKRRLREAGCTSAIKGIFIARTVWPQLDAVAAFADI